MVDLSIITPVVLTFNEEANIERTLDRLGWAARIIVVDSGSTDATPELLARYDTVQRYGRTFDDHASQNNYGLQQSPTDWVLTLDADYVLDEGFEVELRQLEPSDDLVGYFAAFRYCIGGSPLRGSILPARCVLFKKSLAHYVNDGHTQRLTFDGPTEVLTTPILHDDRKPFSRWLQSQRKYAALEVEKLLQTPASALSLNDRIRKLHLVAPNRSASLLSGPEGWDFGRLERMCVRFSTLLCRDIIVSCSVTQSFAGRFVGVSDPHASPQTPLMFE